MIESLASIERGAATALRGYAVRQMPLRGAGHGLEVGVSGGSLAHMMHISSGISFR